MGFRKARLNAGMTVAEVTKSLSVSNAAVYQWETGVTMPTGKRLVEISNLYGCTVDELLMDDTEDVPLRDCTKN